MMRRSLFLLAVPLVALPLAVSSASAEDAARVATAVEDASASADAAVDELLRPLEKRLAQMADRFQAGELDSAEIQRVRRSMRRQLTRAREAGTGVLGRDLRIKLSILEAQVGLFPGEGPKLPPLAIERGGGVVLGRVVDTATGAGIVGASVAAYNDLGQYMTSDQTGVGGYYALGGLAPGGYRVTASENGFVGEVWDDIVCHPYCDPTSGQPIGVTNGTPASGIDFALVATGSMSGVMEEEGTGDSIYGYVELWSTSGALLLEDSVGGSYTIYDLAPGTYFVVSDNYDGFRDELYDDLPCEYGPPASCDVTTGTPVVVVSGQTTPGIDFRLDFMPGGSVSGTVTDAITGAPVSSSFEVTAYRSDGGWAGYASVDGGEYEIYGLDGGEYYLLATSYGPYSPELWEELPCSSSCDPTTGTPVTVVEEEVTEGIDFTVDPPGAIEGLVTDTAGVPLSGVSVRVFGGSYDTDYTDIDGYFRLNEIQPGEEHFVEAESNYHRDELYDDIPCDPNCDSSLGTPIVVGPGQTEEISISLVERGRVRGVVFAAATGARLSSATVRLYDETGNSRGSTSTNGLGEYRFTDVEPGIHYLKARHSLFAEELYEGMACSSGCDPTTGTPIVVQPGLDAEADFTLDRFGRLAGRVTSILTGEALSSCWVSANGTQGGGGVFTDFEGRYELGSLAADGYRVGVFDCDGLAGRLYDDIYCPGGSCNSDDATVIPVAFGDSVTDIDFTLGPALIFIDGFESGSTQVWSSTTP